LKNFNDRKRIHSVTK